MSLPEESVPPPGGPAGRPAGPLRQMEEIMAALNADLSAVDANLQRGPETEAGPGREIAG